MDILNSIVHQQSKRIIVPSNCTKRQSIEIPKKSLSPQSALPPISYRNGENVNPNKSVGGRYVGNLKISKIHQSPMTKGSIPKIPLISSKSLDQQEKKIPRVPKLNKSFETSHTKGITTTSISRPQSSNSNRSRPSETIPIPKTTRLSSGNTSSGIHSKFLSSSPSRPTRQFNLSSPSEAPNSQSAASTRPPHRMIPPIRPPIRPSNLSLQSLRGLIGKGLGRGRPPNPAQNAGGHGNTTNSPSMTSTSTDLKNNSAKPNSIPKSKDASGSKMTGTPPTPKPRTLGGIPQPPLRGGMKPFFLGNTRGGRVSIQGRGMAMARHRSGNSSMMNQRQSEYDLYGLNEYDEEDLDFIDDGPIDDGPSSSDDNWKTALRDITGYNPTRYLGKDEGEASESSWTQQVQEEILSSKIAAVEDAIELKRVQEEGAHERRLREERKC